MLRENAIIKFTWPADRSERPTENIIDTIVEKMHHLYGGGAALDVVIRDAGEARVVVQDVILGLHERFVHHGTVLAFTDRKKNIDNL